jgi:hypothetical protein
MARIVGFVAVAALTTALASCTASLRLDRFHAGDAGAAAQDGDVGALKYASVLIATTRVGVTHHNQYFEVRLVDKNNAVVSKFAYDNVSPADFSVFMGSALPTVSPPYRIDFWADNNNNGKYDGTNNGSITNEDHSWRRVLSEPLPDDVTLANGLYTLTFLHDTNFVDIFTDLQGNKISGADTLLPLNLNVAGGAAYAGKMAEVRVVDKTSGHLVGMHRIGQVADKYTAKVTGILDQQTSYVISMYVDADGNGKYGAGDPSWKVELTSDDSGITSLLDLQATVQTPIDTGEPPP